MKVTNLQFEDVSIPYAFGIDCVGEMIESISGMSRKCFVVTDEVVSALHATRFCKELARHCEVVMLTFPGQGENFKNLETVSALAIEALDKGIDRSSLIIAFGGGVVGNIAGLLAGLIYRGTRFLHVPTTLIAMHDSVLSLKQAINFDRGKNVLGLYYEPQSILADMEFLSTLEMKEVKSGLVESLKNGLAIIPDQIVELGLLVPEILRGGPNSENFLRLLELSIEAKSAVMARDKYERTNALVLEYGHTVGHAIELLHARAVPVGQSIAHGEAVGIGMRIAGVIARNRGMSEGDWRAHEELLDLGGVDRHVPIGVRICEIPEQLLRDNKRGLIPTGRDEVAMILLEALGKPVWTNGLPLTAVSIAEIETALDELNTGSSTAGTGRADEALEGGRL